ncbi:PH domain-containing protein [Candidatus Viridilinea mediisalina]|uniref:Bacterial Pleckstrin homology domain-containing protein n=1 Tax=Candidatus Viridilinea mediisalina TaxID=2024553 RepID=A0A2A6RHI5_9CHLR|nr:PH domain-containing protein [Candidatus Viridilinea mediisalina]PDW02345.1 hypothetical protein CJ255_14430 [Candidatus Viridilinea mediisalina]
MRRWKPKVTWRFGAALATLLVAAVGLVVVLLPLSDLWSLALAAWPYDGALFWRGLAVLVLALVTAVMAYRVAATLTLAYTMDRNGLYINWLGNRMVVPIHLIEQVDRGLGALQSELRPALGLGYLHGAVRLADGQTLHRFTTQPLSHALVVRTAQARYALSPKDADAFLQELEQRRRMGPIQQLNPGFEAGRIFSYAFWEDQIVQAALLVAALINLALVGWLMHAIPTLPALIDLQRDATGTLVQSHQILFFPLAGLALALFNLGLGVALFSRSPVGARLLQVGTVLVQLLFSVAALTLLW